jgi:porin
LFPACFVALLLGTSPFTLGAEGLELGLATTTDWMRVGSGGADEGDALANLTELSMLIDTESLWGHSGGTIFLFGAYTSGDDPGVLTGSIHAPSNLAADEDWRLLEAWYEQRLGDGRTAILGGVYAVDSEFDAKATAEVFTNGAFGTGLDWSESGAEGPGIFPQTGLGIRLRHAFNTQMSARVALVDGAPTGGSFSDRLRVGGNEGAFLISEFEYQPAGVAQHRFAAGGWTYSEDQERFDGRGDTDRSAGAYAFWEGTLYSDPENPGRTLSSFVRLGLSTEATNPVSEHLSGGIAAAGLLPSRSGDITGLGISHGRFSAWVADEVPGSADSETVVELTHAMQVTGHLLVQPVLQYLINPLDAAGKDAFLFGLRVSIGI